jgi:uncharacterized membrane protein (TIGR02234 family)
VSEQGSEQGAAQTGSATAKREYGYALLTGAAGAGIVLLAVRQRWAQAVFTPPKPLAAQVVDVSGSDLVPLAGALALAALAGLAAVIATRGVVRRVAGVLIALFGAGAGAAVLTTVTAATVVNVAVGKIASPQAAALSGAAGSTTSGTSGGTGPLVVAGAAGRAIMSGAPWRVAVLAGALLVFAVGVATALRGPDWPVMSARYDAPESRGGRAVSDRNTDGNADRNAGGNDAASMWESLSGGADPTDLTDPTDPMEEAQEEEAAADGAAPGPSRPAAAGQREGMA